MIALLKLKPLHRVLFIALLVGAALPASAQYKVVGPDGRITYTDIPPSDSRSQVTALNRGSITEIPAPSALPLALRQTAERYPVTLYSSADCQACDAGRQLLQQRGVPYREKLIISEPDVQALQARFGSRSVPALTIGAQALHGVQANEWNAYLDAAGYPRESQLPKGWQPAAPSPLTPPPTLRAQAPNAPAAASAAAAAAPPPTPVKAAPGLRF